MMRSASAGTVEEAVLRYAKLAQASGLGGVVASTAGGAADQSGMRRSFQTVTPGIRPAGADVNDQSRIMTPREALSKERIIWSSAVRLLQRRIRGQLWNLLLRS